MGRWYTWSYWAQEEKIRAIFHRLGYETMTVRCYLKQEFGYKNGREIVEDLKVKESFLRAILVFKDDEIPELNRRMSDLLIFIRDNTGWWVKNVGVLRTNVNSTRYNIEETVAWFQMKYRFKSVIEEILNIEDWKTV